MDVTVLKEVTTFTRRSPVEVQGFEAIQSELETQPPILQRPRGGFRLPDDLSPSEAFAMKTVARPKKLLLIGETRWNATFYAIRRAYHLRQAIIAFLLDRNPPLLAQFLQSMRTVHSPLASFSISQNR